MAAPFHIPTNNKQELQVPHILTSAYFSPFFLPSFFPPALSSLLMAIVLDMKWHLRVFICIFDISDV